jgi:hypothetical protein
MWPRFKQPPPEFKLEALRRESAWSLNRGSISDGNNIYLPLHSIQTLSRAHPASYNRLGGKEAWFWISLHPSNAEAKNCGAVPPSPHIPHCVVLDYIIKCWNVFTFSGSLCPFIQYMSLGHGRFDQAQVACSKRASGIESSQRMASEVEEVPLGRRPECRTVLCSCTSM